MFQIWNIWVKVKAWVNPNVPDLEHFVLLAPPRDFSAYIRYVAYVALERTFSIRHACRMSRITLNRNISLCRTIIELAPLRDFSAYIRYVFSIRHECRMSRITLNWNISLCRTMIELRRYQRNQDSIWNISTCRVLLAPRSEMFQIWNISLTLGIWV